MASSEPAAEFDTLVGACDDGMTTIDSAGRRAVQNTWKAGLFFLLLLDL